MSSLVSAVVVGSAISGAAVATTAIGIGGSLLAAKSASDAAETQADAISRAADISLSAAEQARKDVIDSFDGIESDTILFRNKETGEEVESGRSIKDIEPDLSGDENEDAINTEFATQFFRAPLEDGFEFWKDKLEDPNSGVTLENLSSSIANEAGDGDLVRAQFGTLFGREPSEADLTFWKGQLSNPESGVTLENLGPSIKTDSLRFEEVPGGAFAILADAGVKAQDALAAGLASTTDILAGSTQQSANIVSQFSSAARGALLGLPVATQAGTTPVAPFQGNIFSSGPSGEVLVGGRVLTPGETPLPTGDPNEDAIRAEYARLFGREPDPAGLDFWKQQLADPTTDVSLSNISEAISNAGRTELANIAQANEASALAGTSAERQEAGLLPALSELEQAPQFLTPFTETGTTSLLQQSALTGGQGVEAQQQAFDQFIESPGQKFLREKQEESLLRNQAALGGLGGGNVRTALQEQAFGIAAQQQQQQFENLGSLTATGLSAAGTQSSLEQQLALERANLRSAAGTDLSRIALGEGATIAGLSAGLGADVGQLTTQESINQANLISQLGAGGANLATSQGTLLANIGVESGTIQSNLATDIGSAQAAGILGQGSAIQQGLTGVATSLGQVAAQPVVAPRPTTAFATGTFV